MNLAEAFCEECIAIEPGLKNADDVLRAVARLAMRSPAAAGTDEEEIFRAIKHREEVGSTGFGNGIAIPHCRLNGLESFTVGTLVVPDGVSFAALDDKPVRVFVFIVGPERDTTEHIRILSAISQALCQPNAVQEILAAHGAEAIRESFLRRIRDDAPAEAGGHRLMHLFVQQEEIFQDLLQILSSLTPSVMVIESRNTSAYLSKMPLFAEFWSDDPLGFSRIVTALLPKNLTNEAIRRIEQVAGHLNEARGIAVSVQDVFYAAGQLDA